MPLPSIKPITRLVLTNAIYFKGDWAKKFKEENTKELEFFTSAESKVNAQMMAQEDEFDYYEDNQFQYLELPYKGEDISMLILLPKSEEGIDYKFHLPSAEDFVLANNQMHKTKVIVNLPKFKLETEYQMKEDLQSMGMIEAFTDGANFSKMDPANYLKIDQIYHKAFVEVNEKGTEATAATAVVMTGKSSADLPTFFNANHPFAFIIKDNTTEEILFIGKVIDPTEEK